MKVLQYLLNKKVNYYKCIVKNSRTNILNFHCQYLLSIIYPKLTMLNLLNTYFIKIVRNQNMCIHNFTLINYQKLTLYTV